VGKRISGMEETRKKVAVGLAQIERGEVVSSDVVMARLQEKIRIARENKKYLQHNIYL
jgi:antitoxin ParD1/3/4